MIRGCKGRRRSNSRRMAKSKGRSSDESDEDYLVDEEFEESEDECNLTVDEEDLDEMFGGLEKEFVEKKWKKVGKSTAKGGLRGWGRGTRQNRSVKPKKKRKALCEDVEDEDDDSDDEDYDFSDEKMKEVVRPRKKKRTAHRDLEEEDDDDDERTEEVIRPRKKRRTANRGVVEEEDAYDEDYVVDDEKIKEVKKPIKKKRTAHRAVRRYIGSTGANSGDVKKNEMSQPREKKRVWHREEEGSDNDADTTFVKPRGRQGVSHTENKEGFTTSSEEDFDVSRLNVVRKPRRKRKVAYKEVDDDFDITQEEDFDSEKGAVDEKPTTGKLVAYREEDDFGIKHVPEVQNNNKASKSRNKKEISYREDDDYDGMDDNDEDEEFAPDEIDDLDDEEELPLMEDNDLDKPVLLEKQLSYREDDDDEDYDGIDDNEVEEFKQDEINNLDDKEELPLMKKENNVDKPVLWEKEESYNEDDGEYDGMDDNDEVEKLMPNEINDLDDEEEEEEEEEEELPLMKKEKKVGKPEQREVDESYREDDDDYDGISDEDEDEEFTPDEIDDLDDEEELSLMKQKKKVGKPMLRETRVSRRQKRKRNLMVSKKAVQKKPKGNYGLRSCANDEKFVRKKSILEERNKKVHRRGKKRRLTINSDSDLVSSGSSDYEFTISEEEREQIREANEFCRNLLTSSRSSIFSELLEEKKEVLPQRKRLTRKGKEKVGDEEVEVGKQVCGICLTEEGKRTIRGTLNCCSHYFCFTCIMEWSKVESRCPLCKQRFATISKPAKCNTGFDLRTVVIQIPERDQVYQPSEEELQGFLDPYDNVICTECHQGGDDALMLLCDLCDSPAHTYCVGLGREVPEGNWYCDGCRPTALGSPNPQVLTPTADHRTTTYASIGSSPSPNIRETFDLNEMYVPDTSLAQESSQVPSPRPPVGDGQLPSPGSGSGAHTVLGRRRIQRQIHNILNNRWRHLDNQTRETLSSVSGRSLFGVPVGQNREFSVQQVATPEVVPEDNMGLNWSLRDSAMPLMQHRDLLCARFSHMREQSREDYPSTSTNPSFGSVIPNEFSGLNSRVGLEVGHQQLQPYSVGPNADSDPGMSSYPYREVSPFMVEKSQIQYMVISQLIRLSRDLQLAHSTFKSIARSSTHTILAICGAEHRQRDVHPVQTSLTCQHTGGTGNFQTGQAKGPCLPCFDHFVKGVVCEIMSIILPISSKS